APVSGIEELLTTALKNTHRFRITERMDMGAVQQEQHLGAEGSTAPQTAPAAGRILGAQYLIKATVIEWKDNTGGSHGVGGGATGSVPGIGGVGWSTSKAEIAMAFKVIDAMSGEVVDSRTARATAKNWSFTPAAIAWTPNSVAGGIATIQRNSPAHYAVVSCVNKAVFQIVTALKERPWKGAVMQAGDGGVYVNGGAEAGLKVGMKLEAVGKGPDLTDP